MMERLKTFVFSKSLTSDIHSRLTYITKIRRILERKNDGAFKDFCL